MSGELQMMSLLNRAQQRYEEETKETEVVSSTAISLDRLEILRDLQFLIDGQSEPEEAQDALFAEAMATKEFCRLLRRPGAVQPQERDVVGEETLYETLAELLSFESNAEERERFSRRPDIDERSVWSRVVKARLQRLGVAGNTATFQAWSDEDNDTMRRLIHTLTGGDFLRPAALRRDEWDIEIVKDHPSIDSDRWFGISGDAVTMLDLLRTNSTWRDRWFVARSAGNTYLKPVNYKKLAVTTQAKFRRERGFFAPSNPRAIEPNRQMEMDGNRLGVRLIKIRLWQLGYYEGDLNTDTFSGDVLRTFNSLKDADEDGGRQQQLPRRDFLAKFTDTTFAINPHFLHYKLLKRIDASRYPGPTVLDTTHYVTVTERQISAKEPEHIRSETRKLNQRQRNRPLNRLFRTPLRLIRMAAHAVRRELYRAGQAIGELVSPLRSLIMAPLTAFRRISERLVAGVLQFVRFVVGRPFGIVNHNSKKDSVDGVVARFSMDRDAETMVIGRNDQIPSLIIGYHRLVRKLTNALELGLSLCIMVVLYLVPPFSLTQLIGLSFRLMGEIRRAILKRVEPPVFAPT